ncbi:MAG: helix-turn-helix domain-containing protein [Rhodospirillaceae bacterium]|nr:helix-turn-helix domain-containing protein [Rhodospirillaceae bacterium]
MLDFDTCDRARLRRDARYDGLFFTGVKTTGIDCRPVCPVKPALTRNVLYFPSAPAAERAGFRPCLRCRPETAPFCPAWNGTKTTVERALKLIDDRALDADPVDHLAARRGVGTRHLARLFQKHIGASPLQTAKTFRVQRAKRLLNETDLPMTEIAFRAGFKSVRRFNSVFRELYGRAPSEMRRGPARRSSAPPSQQELQRRLA